MVEQKTLLNVVEAAERRRSIRDYQPRPMPEEDLRKILRVAGLAPSAWNIQPWRVTVVRDPERKAKLQEAAFGQRQVGSAPVVLVVWSDMKDAMEHMDEFVHPGMPADRAEDMKATIRRVFGDMGAEAAEQWAQGQTYIFLGYLLLAISSFGYASSPMLGFDPVVRQSLARSSRKRNGPGAGRRGRGRRGGLPPPSAPAGALRQVRLIADRIRSA
jgi:nitroreductase